MTLYSKKLLLMILCVVTIMVLITLTLDSKNNTGINNGFNRDYDIDLQEDGYLVRDESGKVHYVPAGKLEEWFLDDNL